ncbi:hypothetical protein K450DRAFT_281338 [Umbelopsis ramanniana AG]|uniref:Uncharacterized protein n=1 Tax=Umbelopsis ramanniana AG TaxID=1314678 RepID=A0AAD5HEC9_UMBRA|nr:uncharacterized protein K450DRAFT_281338 [Umbelopsis ramanniana AG]KAI8578853.1 hypothetical protein K450DRAFT_281338 [Umbelopsis ramanniana AG]
MFSLNPFYYQLCVLFPKNLDIKSIQKCPIDDECDFTPLEGNVASGRLGSAFVILQKDHFTAHIAGHTIKCDYNCRNRVMSVLSSYRHLGRLDDEKEIVETNFGLDLIDDVVQNNELPHLIFSNERYPERRNTNTIQEHFISVDIQKFAEITKSKPCNQDSFIVCLGRKNYIHYRFMCCNVKTLETYEYTSETKSRIEKELIDNVDGCFAIWKAEDEARKLSKPAKRVSNFHLVDSQGHPVKENTDYYLEMHDQPNDVLKIKEYKPIIYATYHLNRADRIVVRYSIIDGIHYLICEDQFLQVHDFQDEIGFKDKIPEKEKRIEFHTTENNTFRTAQWDNDIWLTFQKETLNHSSVTFNDNEAVVRWDKPLELILKRVQT